MSRSNTDLLTDLRDYLDKAASFTLAGRDAFYADEMIQFAVIRVYEVTSCPACQSATCRRRGMRLS